MALSSSGEVAAALREFVQRIDAFDPLPAPAPAPAPASTSVAAAVEIVVGDQVLSLRAPVAKALVEALLAYHDPRDRGSCDHCGGPRLDENFVCANCGQPSGVFGQLLRERAARYEGPPGALPS
jgi:hypothetical protein